ncbi:hypothetical protein HHK36_011383 [Tetracentron sinense]|uniref:Tyrosine specific protein phosphatases domain-containing protein n=1 Tax=Tetracentron sinense TaxID=13715 RepID=A0A834ZG87_TETSI|nr:hypothetical protein HHK36_011383 [Tetracentron sinense]
MSLGISQVIGFKATVMFLVFACLRSSGLTLFSIPFLHASLVDFLVSITSLPSVNLPLLLGKSIDGRIPIWSILVFSPFFCLVRFFAFWWSFKGREAPYSEICEGLYVGGWPSSLDKLPPNDPAIIDCTCELPRNVALSRNPYLCIPTWDTRAPRPLEIEYAVRWACQQRAKKRPVFIHCAHGIALDFD